MTLNTYCTDFNIKQEFKTEQISLGPSNWMGGGIMMISNNLGFQVIFDSLSQWSENYIFDARF